MTRIVEYIDELVIIFLLEFNNQSFLLLKDKKSLSPTQKNLLNIPQIQKGLRNENRSNGPISLILISFKIIERIVVLDRLLTHLLAKGVPQRQFYFFYYLYFSFTLFCIY